MARRYAEGDDALSSEMPLRLHPGERASDLSQRIALHKQDLIEGFTKKYRVHLLIYYEMRPTMDAAILREKQVKEWGASSTRVRSDGRMAREE